MNLSSCTNFREVGALGRGRLYRSDHLGALNAADATLMSRLGIRRVIDLRGVNERSSAPCVLPAAVVHSLPIEPTIVQVLTELIDAGHRPTTAEVVSHMQNTYRGLVLHNTHRYAELFCHLLRSDEPTVFHCVAGKDRTGLASALILYSLGRSADDVMRDYLLSNERLKVPAALRYGVAPEVALVLARVQPEFLGAAFAAIDSEYGGLEGYLRDGLRLGKAERDRLRELYL